MAKRRALGLTVKEAGAREGVHWRHWQKIEAGQINITFRTVSRVADALDVVALALFRPLEEAADREAEMDLLKAMWLEAMWRISPS